METHDHQLHFNRQPFEDSVDTAFFFPGGMRRDIVDEIKSALLGGVSLITLIGPEGSGKTMICRMVEKELPVGLRSVFLPRTVESFSDMVEIVGREVISNPEQLEAASTEDLLRAIAESLRERGQRLLIVFEEAEKIYLATLERIRKMLDRVNENGLLLHLLFSGPPQLSDSLEQLSIVAFHEVEERNLVLDDVDQETARDYLNHCLAIATGKQDDLFPAEIVAGIISASGGNFGKINHLAREYLQSEQMDAPFLVLLDTINETQHQATSKRPRRSRATPGMPKVDLDFLALPKMRTEWLFYGGGVAVVVVLLFLLFGRSTNDSEPEQDLSGVPVIELRRVEPLTAEATAERPPALESVPASETPAVPVIPRPQSSVEKETDGEPEAEGRFAPIAQNEPAPEEAASADEVIADHDDRPEAAGEAKAVEQSSATAEAAPEKKELAAVVVVPPVLAPKQLKRVPSKPAGSEDNGRKAAEHPVVEEKAAEKTVTPPPDVAPEPVPIARVTKVEATPEQPVVKPPTERKEVVQPSPVRIREEEKKEAPVVAVSGNNSLYKERLAAGARWLVGGGAGRFTVQLMVLTSELAEENLKQIFEDKDYRAIADDLFVLRRFGSPPTVMLYYGEYRTLAAAQQARNTLPVFLRKHDPYPISVNAVVEKTRALQ